MHVQTREHAAQIVNEPVLNLGERVLGQPRGLTAASSAPIGEEAGAASEMGECAVIAALECLKGHEEDAGCETCSQMAPSICEYGSERGDGNTVLPECVAMVFIQVVMIDLWESRERKPCWEGGNL